VTPNGSFIPLLIVLVIAFAVPVVLARFRRFGIPIVVGELLAGILIGRSGLRLVPESDPFLDLMAEFGFVFLMFLAGLEVDFSNLGVLGGARPRNRAGRPGPVSLGGMSFGITLAVSTLLAFGLVGMGLANSPWMVALILSTTSLGVVMPVLKERGLSTGRYGQAILVATLIADFGTMLLITVVVAALSSGLTFDVLLIGLLFAAGFLLYRFAGVLTRVPGIRRTLDELSHATAQVKVRAAFALMLMFVALSQALGTEIILGAFLAGTVLALLRTPEDIETIHKLEAIGFGFFIPLFFIQVGIRFNLGALMASSAALLVPLLLVAAIFVKLVPSFLFRLSFTWRETLAAGVLLSARLSLIIAASAIGLRLGVISESTNSAIILVAIITVTAAPLVFGRVLGEAGGTHKRPVIVIGLGELGLHVARELQGHGERVIGVDPNEEAVIRARRHGLESIYAPLEQPSGPLSACLEAADTVVCTHRTAQVNQYFAQLARRTFGIDNVVVDVNDPAQIGLFEHIGARPVNAALDRAALLVLLARSPTAYALLTRTEDDKEVCELAVEDGPYVGKALRELALPGDTLVLAMHRNGDLVVPHGDTRIQTDDRLTLVGSVECLAEASQLFR
jgi:Kef-type K+ transport system membrane component KefB/Trk K+ transport system NAD-binding subunit